MATELSDQCKYGVVTSQLFRFSRRCNRSNNFWEATRHLLEHMVGVGYKASQLLRKVKAFRHQLNCAPLEWTRQIRRLGAGLRLN